MTKIAVHRRALLLTASVLLSGCMVGPDHVRPDVTLPARFSALPADPSAAAIARGWWKLFEDDALNALVDRALIENSDVQRAVARIEQADALLREVGRGAVSRRRARCGGEPVAHQRRRIADPGRCAAVPQQLPDGDLNVFRNRFLGQAASRQRGGARAGTRYALREGYG
jgi:hypothetical protein